MSIQGKQQSKRILFEADTTIRNDPAYDRKPSQRLFNFLDFLYFNAFFDKIVCLFSNVPYPGRLLQFQLLDKGYIIVNGT